jgi:hypothetical protein
MELNEICNAIELMGSEMTSEQSERTMSEIKTSVGQDELQEVESAALMANSPIYAELRCYRSEMGY